ncbi:MAG: GH1 family beta-glucosidase [Pseudomonadota bacterium]
MQNGRAAFPEDFTFGAATSSYQIEGQAYGGAGPTHWDTFAATPGNVVGGENGAVACDHYHRSRVDLNLAAAANLDIYRFSTNWARILPNGTGRPNPEGLDFYDRLVDDMLDRDLAPYLTLYHWELPAALADLGGWTNPEIAHWFTDYARLVLARIGDRVASVATFNEPWCITWAGHFNGTHAPGLRDIRATARSIHNLLRSNGLAMNALRVEGYGNLGIVLNLDWVQPADDSVGSAEAAALYDACFNRCFLDPLFRGQYPERMLAGLAPHLPNGWEHDVDGFATPLDWLGVNYYTRKLVQPSDNETFPEYAFAEGPLPKTTMGWEIYPDGLTQILTRVAQDYSGDLPLYVTESGMSADEPETATSVDDIYRIQYLDHHFAAARAAIDAGVPLKGYIVWSLLDNFEWARGYARRFGMVHTDFNTLERTPKASYHALSTALARPGDTT